MGADSSDLNRSKTLRSYRCEYWLAPVFIRIGKKLNVPHNSIYSLYFLLRLSPPGFQARLTVSFAPPGSSKVFKDRRSFSWRDKAHRIRSRFPHPSVIKISLSRHSTTLHPLCAFFVFNQRLGHSSGWRRRQTCPFMLRLNQLSGTKLKSQTAPSSPFRGKEKHTGIR